MESQYEKREEAKKQQTETEKLKNEKIEDYGQVTLENRKSKTRIELLTIIGEIEGHACVDSQNKATKYEHILPKLAMIEDSEEIDGVLFLLNTIGGDVEAGLAIAEMIASMSKPTVSLVLGGSHSIGVPLAVAADYSFIVPTGTMIVHPVRISGMVIGVTQTFLYMEQIQDRILHFVESHSQIGYEKLRHLMLDTSQMVKDVGSILSGEEAVAQGVINEIGGVKEALAELKRRIGKQEV